MDVRAPSSLKENVPSVPAAPPAAPQPRPQPRPSRAHEHSRNTLRGISSVYVLVGDLQDNAKQGGLDEQDIQTDAELKLRLAGIKVATKSEWVQTPGSPCLYIDVVTVLSHDEYAVYVSVRLEQNVVLDRDRSISHLAPTWSVGSIGNLSKSNFSHVRDRIKDDVDDFLNAYLSVNPKK